jgi:hypothetical protein
MTYSGQILAGALVSRLAGRIRGHSAAATAGQHRRNRNQDRGASRVLRPGGRMVLSDLHPTAVGLGGVAYFQDAHGGAGVIRGFGHLHCDYLNAFQRAALVVRQCLEPRFGPAEAMMQGSASDFIPDAAAAAFVGVPELSPGISCASEVT